MSEHLTAEDLFAPRSSRVIAPGNDWDASLSATPCGLCGALVVDEMTDAHVRFHNLQPIPDGFEIVSEARGWPGYHARREWEW